MCCGRKRGKTILDILLEAYVFLNNKNVFFNRYLDFGDRREK